MANVLEAVLKYSKQVSESLLEKVMKMMISYTAFLTAKKLTTIWRTAWRTIYLLIFFFLRESAEKDKILLSLVESEILFGETEAFDEGGGLQSEEESHLASEEAY
ncbi:hypothetical protein ACJX0J_025165, partial [Zea mays]